MLAFTVLIAAWSIVCGAALLTAANRLDRSHGRGWLILGAVAGSVFGMAVILAPLAGAVVLTWWIGAYALVFGAALLVLGFKLRARRDERPRASRTAAI